MHLTTTVHIRCRCHIPNYTQLKIELENLFSNTIDRKIKLSNDLFVTNSKILKNHLLFIQISYPAIKVTTTMLELIGIVFKKTVIGIIEAGSDEITLILA